MQLHSVFTCTTQSEDTLASFSAVIYLSSFYFTLVLSSETLISSEHFVLFLKPFGNFYLKKTFLFLVFLYNLLFFPQSWLPDRNVSPSMLFLHLSVETCRPQLNFRQLPVESHVARACCKISSNINNRQQTSCGNQMLKKLTNYFQMHLMKRMEEQLMLFFSHFNCHRPCTLLIAFRNMT